MVKYIYKTVILLVIFVGALFFFGRQMETDINDSGTGVEMAEERYPVLQLQVRGHKVNTLYGYSAPMEPDIIRESMTPLDAEKKITVLFGEAKSRLIKLQYQIVDKETGEIYDTWAVNALEEGQKSLDLTFDYNFKTSTEYILDIKTTSNEGREIHYYTRLKYYLDESYLPQKLNFVKEFHKNTFDKSKMEELERYLEPSMENTNSTFAKVDITSNSEMITWGALSPKVISDEQITIKEYNMETACVQYNYFIQAKTGSGKEIYHVKEFYRVRYASGINYLLNFERTLEAQFDPANASTKTNQLKLGITNEYESRMMTTKAEDALFFARGGDLYRYDMEGGDMTKVYSSFSENASYQYRAYDEQSIRLLRIDDEDNLYFCVYGYFPRGIYEGDVAVVLYEYSAEGELHEMIAMPISSTYQQLKEDFEDYGYVSTRGVYYFTVANTVYAYNIVGKRLEKIAENVKSNTFMTMEDINCYVWSSSLKTGYGESITIYNLETDEKHIIYQPDKDTYIRLLGVIQNNVIYGYVKKDDVTKMKDGSKIIPCYELYIADVTGEVKEKYSRKGKYIQSIKASENVINMTLCKKADNNRYVDAGEGSILNQSEVQAPRYFYSSRVTSQTLTEWYIRFPYNFIMKKIPEWKEGPSEVTTNERLVRLEEPGIAKYYIYALGKITGCYESAAKAIREADNQMGVVVSSNHQVVWERSGSFIQNTIGGISLTRAGNGVSSLEACAHMMLKQNHVNIQLKDLKKENASVYEMISPYMQRPVNLKGCTLDQVLYFVSNNKSVVAMTGDNKAVLIGGYTGTSLSLYDPAYGTKRTVSRAEYKRIFENAGNRFVSYMEE